MKKGIKYGSHVSIYLGHDIAAWDSQETVLSNCR